MTTRQQLLISLSHTYCRLAPSPTHGVGVFAIRDIPANTNPFYNIRKPKWLVFKMSELVHLDPEILPMIDDFFVIEKDGTVEIPEGGLNGMDMSYYINNSNDFNVKAALTDDELLFITVRDIQKGEELTVAYETYDYKFQKIP